MAAGKYIRKKVQEKWKTENEEELNSIQRANEEQEELIKKIFAREMRENISTEAAELPQTIKIIQLAARKNAKKN